MRGLDASITSGNETSKSIRRCFLSQHDIASTFPSLAAAETAPAAPRFRRPPEVRCNCRQPSHYGRRLHANCHCGAPLPPFTISGGSVARLGHCELAYTIPKT
ncbi:unnamed protein product, partial [Iphiclides podalirius]